MDSGFTGANLRVVLLEVYIALAVGGVVSTVKTKRQSQETPSHPTLIQIQRKQANVHFSFISIGLAISPSQAGMQGRVSFKTS